MEAVLEKALGYVGIILLGYMLKHKQWIAKEATSSCSTLMMKLTLPCAILINMNGKTIENSLYFLVVLGILFNGATLLIGMMTNKSKEEKAFAMINLSGFNLGGFAMPFVSGFFSNEALLVTSMFDMGNSLMCLGMNGGIVASLMSGKKTLNLKSIARKVSESIPIWMYGIMLLMSMGNIEIPKAFIPMIQTMSQANPMVAMLMIGLSIEFTFESKQIKTITKCLMLRFISALSMAILCLILPLSQEITSVLIVLCFSPISAVTPIYTRQLGLDGETSACINSIYVLISIAMMSCCIYMLQGFI